MCGNLIYTGIHVYTLTLKRDIPKIIQMGGRRVRTKYNGQDRHQMEKEEKEKVMRKQEQEMERQIDDTNTEQTVTPPNTGVNKVDTAPASPVAEEEATTKIVDEEGGLSKEQFCEAMETSIGFVHKDMPFEQAGSKRKKKGKKGKDSEDEGQVKRSLARCFKIDMDILELTVQNKMVDRLPVDAFDDGQFTRGMLYGLFYLMQEGDLHDQEWYVKDSPLPRIDGSLRDM